MNKIFRILLIFLGLTLTISCTKSDGGDPVTPKVSRTVLAYIAGNNSLSDYAEDNLAAIIAGSNSSNLGGNYIVYYHVLNQNPQLIQIKLDSKGKAYANVLKEYPGQNSATKETMQSIINETMSMFPANEYGLILWSHGSGWIPYDYSVSAIDRRMAVAPFGEVGEELIRTQRAFGQSGSTWMNLSDLEVAIPDNKFKFILFDACLMANIEVAYALRNKAQYIVASPAEVLADGFPYESMTGDLFAQTVNLTGICDKFYDKYNKLSGFSRTATVSITQTNKLDALAEATRAVVDGRYADIQGLYLRDIQQFGRSGVYNWMFFDFENFISKLDSDKKAAFDKALTECVIYKKHTPQYLNNPINKFCGLTSYIPAITYTSLNKEYMKTTWAKKVYGQ